MRLLVAILLNLFFSTTVISAPVLLFSDITSGPKTGIGDGLGSGAIVTVWGTGLGSTQGSSTIKVGAVEAAYIYEWANATQHTGHPSDLYTYHKMQTISFSVPASAVDGANTISVTVDGATSNTLPFTVRTGNIYHIKSTGNDGTGDGSWSTPWLTMQYYSDGLAGDTAVAGDIAYVHDVTTELPIDVNYLSGKQGTEANPFAMVAYPGTSPVMNSNATYGIGSDGRDDHYFHFSKIKFTGQRSIVTLIREGRIIGCEVTDHPTLPPSSSQVGVFQTGCNGNTNDPTTCGGEIMYGNYIHDNFQGDNYSQMHTTYFSNRTAGEIDPFDFGWNLVKGSDANHAVHTYDEGDCGGYTGTVKIHDNFVVENSGVGIGINTGCASGYETAGSYDNTYEVYNNVIIGAGKGPERSNGGWYEVAMYFGTGTGGNAYGANYTVNVYNNTIYGWGEVGSSATTLITGAFRLNPNFTAINFKNNIIYDVYDKAFDAPADTDPTTHTNNLWHDPDSVQTVPTWDTSPITTDPLFTSAGTNDFSLTSGSPAKDTGWDASAVLITDIIGTTRSSFDIGAYEYYATQAQTRSIGNINQSSVKMIQ